MGMVRTRIAGVLVVLALLSCSTEEPESSLPVLRGSDAQLKRPVTAAEPGAPAAENAGLRADANALC